MPKTATKPVFVPLVAQRWMGCTVRQINTSPLRRTLRAMPSNSSVYRKIRLQVSPVASYSADTYGPVGGDARIKVIGVGGGGGNAVNRMISSGLQVGLCVCVDDADVYSMVCDLFLIFPGFF